MSAIPKPAHFATGDHVRWSRAKADPNKVHVPGIIMKVIPCDSCGAFTMYDIKFDFGTFTLYDTQIQPE